MTNAEARNSASSAFFRISGFEIRVFPVSPPRTSEPNRQVCLLEREAFDVFLGPGGGLGVVGAFGVVALVAEHFADAADELGEGLAGAPVVADADFGGVDVGVKDGR